MEGERLPSRRVPPPPVSRPRPARYFEANPAEHGGQSDRRRVGRRQACRGRGSGASASPGPATLRSELSPPSRLTVKVEVGAAPAAPGKDDQEEGRVQATAGPPEAVDRHGGRGEAQVHCHVGQRLRQREEGGKRAFGAEGGTRRDGWQGAAWGKRGWVGWVFFLSFLFGEGARRRTPGAAARSA